MFRPRRFLVVTALVVAPTLIGSDAQASANCVHGWKAYALPSWAELNAVDAVSADDVWAVGSSFRGYMDWVPIAEHFDGTGWTQVPLPSPHKAYVGLQAIDMRTSSDGWAGGLVEKSSGNRMFLLHWDGRSWSNVKLPPPADDAAPGGIGSISALSANDVWVVGSVYTNPGTSGAAFHWDGTSWSQSALPLPSDPYSWLFAVSALDHSDVWAAGTLGNGALILHWDGTSWSQPPVPPTTDRQSPISINALAGTQNDLLALGTQSEDLCCEGSYWLHWDGFSWTEALAGGGPTWGGDISGNDIWVVGGWGGGDAWVSHFDGTSWVSSYPRERSGPTLNAIAAVPGRAWVVGAIRMKGAPNWALRSC